MLLMAQTQPTPTKQGEPIAPSAGETEREMDPTKRKREDKPEERGAPDMGGDMPQRGTDKDVPHTTPTR